MHRFWYAYPDLDGADHCLPNIPQGREGGIYYLAPDLLQCDRIFCASGHGMSVNGSILCLLLYSRELGMGEIIGGFGCLDAITFLISASCHRNLQEGKDTLVIDRLVRTNWWRTVLWTIAFVVSVVIYYS